MNDFNDHVAASAVPPPGGLEPIAIVGMGCRFPGADSPAALWALLREGRDAVGIMPARRTKWFESLYGPNWAKRLATLRGGFLPDIDQFDADYFGITPREAVYVDPQQRLLLETAVEALDDAGVVLPEWAGRSVGVFVGLWTNDYTDYVNAVTPHPNMYTTTGGGRYAASGRLSFSFDFRGPSVTLDTACSSSLVALHLACQSLRSGESEMSLVGAANVIMTLPIYSAYSEAAMLSRDGRCKFGDDSADGYVRSEGAAVIVLKTLTRAQADGDLIRALILDSAVANDGRSGGSLVAPGADAQERTARTVYRRTGIAPAQVDFIEAHGTGTTVGDRIELSALGRVFGSGREGRPPCPVGSVKSNIGHTEPVAGLAGLIKCVLALQHGKLPPTLHVAHPSQRIDWESLHLRLNDALTDINPQRQAALAAINSFGVSGTNAHVLLQAASAPAPAKISPCLDIIETGPLALLVSARSEAALHAMADRFAQQTLDPNVPLDALCHTAAVRRSHHPWRAVAIGSDRQALAHQLQCIQRGEATWSAAAYRHCPTQPRVALVFSGQGALAAESGCQLFDSQPIFRQTMEEIDRVFSSIAGWSLLDGARKERENNNLAGSIVAQPLTFAIQVALVRMLEDWGIHADLVVGHSLGEVAAAHVGGALSLADAVRVAYHRARLMQQVAGNGKTAAVQMTANEAQSLVSASQGKLALAAINGPNSVTLSGTQRDLEIVRQFAADEERFYRELDAPFAFHSSQMDPLTAELTESLSVLRPTRATARIYSTVRGGLAAESDFDADYWARNLRQTVQFAPAVSTMFGNDAPTVILEVSPHPVLSSALRACAKNTDIAVERTLHRDADEPLAMLEAAAAMHMHGCTVKWSKLLPQRGHLDSLPTYPWQREAFWMPDEPQPTFSPQVAEVSVNSQVATTARALLHEVRWYAHECFRQARHPRPTDHLPSPQVLAEDMERAKSRQFSPVEWDLASGCAQDLDRLSVAYIVHAMRELDWALLAGESFVPCELFVKLRIAAQHAALWNRLIEILAEESIVAESGGAWRVVRTPESTVLAQEVDALLVSRPRFSSELTLLSRCGARLASVLRGEQDPLALIFPDGSTDETRRLYADAWMCRVPNAMLRQAITSIGEQLPRDRTLRVLEIGAGTGGTTEHLLNCLPPDRTEYVFTDLSELFLQRAADRFEAYPFVRYALFNAEQPPIEQGFSPQQFDVVLASNAIHATRDLAATLRHVRELLAPGGMLLLIEGVRPTRWVDLVFGLTDGWWRFSGHDELRQGYPLLSPDQWRTVLAETGFAAATATPTWQGDAGAVFAQCVVAAIASPAVSQVVSSNGEARHSASSTPAAVATSAAPRWIVLADRRGVGERFAAQMQARGDTCRLVFADAEHVQLDGERWSIDPANGNHLEALWRGARLDGASIIHLWSLDASADINASRDEFLAQPTAFRTADEAAALVRSLLAATSESCRIWFVTEGCQAVEPHAAIQPAGAVLWGLGRGLSVESPGHYGGLIDLDATDHPNVQAECLCRQLSDSDEQREVAYRHGARRIPYLLRASDRWEHAGLECHGDGCYLITGGLGGLGLETAQWLADHGARSLILTSRTGLAEHAGVQTSEAIEVARQRRDFIATLQARGVNVNVVAVDVADEPQMRQLFHDILRGTWGPLRGVVHAAGVQHRQLLIGSNPDLVAEDLRAKIIGAHLLNRLTPQQDLDFFVLYSSFLVQIPVAGLAPYLAANAYLDALAAARRAHGHVATTVNWGVWSGYGMLRTEEAQRAAAGLTALGFASLPRDAAFAALEKLVLQNATTGVVTAIVRSQFQAAFANGELPQSCGQLARGEVRADGETTAPSDSNTAQSAHQLSASPAQPSTGLLAQLVNCSPSDRQTALEDFVLESVAAVIRRAPQAIDRRKTLGDLGIDSLMCFELVNRCQSALGVVLTVTSVWNHPTIPKLAAHLASKLSLAPASTSVEEPKSVSPSIASTQVAKPVSALRIPTTALSTNKDQAAGLQEMSDDDALAALLGRGEGDV